MYKWVDIIEHVLYVIDVIHQTQSNYQNTYQNKFLAKILKTLKKH